MRRLSPLLISLIVLASLLAHHMHAPVASAGVPAEAAVAAHGHHGVQELQVVDHGMLDDIRPELCTIGDPAPPSPSNTTGHVADLTPAAGAGVVYWASSPASVWETPVVSSDVLRALLQVYLN